MTYRNRKLLDLAHGAPCMAAFAHECQGPSIPAHSNELRFGRGVGHKSHDWAFAACCHVAHDFIDGRRGGWTKEEKHAEWMRAFIKTQTWLWENGKLRTA